MSSARARATAAAVPSGARAVRIALAALLVLLTGCASKPPSRPEDICAVFREKDGWFEEWFEDAADAEEAWNIPIPVMMATMYQESKFRAKAKPPRGRLLWIIPWKRPSSAYGYAQVLDETWDGYRKATGNGGAERDDFGDAVDFVGWYHDGSAKKLGIPRSDANRLYLAYHEGQKGYQRGTHQKKKWLLDVAKKVEGRAQGYTQQLKKCRDELEGPWWWPF